MVDSREDKTIVMKHENINTGPVDEVLEASRWTNNQFAIRLQSAIIDAEGNRPREKVAIRDMFDLYERARQVGAQQLGIRIMKILVTDEASLSWKLQEIGNTLQGL